jgi:hypothetical protein
MNETWNEMEWELLTITLNDLNNVDVYFFHILISISKLIYLGVIYIMHELIS